MLKILSKKKGRIILRSTINVTNNNGIISTGDNNKNTVYYEQNDIKWEKLSREISDLKLNSDASIRKFAGEAAEATEKKDKRGILDVIRKWIPCIGGLIESSYYIIEIAKSFNIGIG